MPTPMPAERTWSPRTRGTETVMTGTVFDGASSSARLRVRFFALVQRSGLLPDPTL